MTYNDRLKDHQYTLAHEDADFLSSEESRSVRMKLEYDRVESVLQQHGVKSTVVMFGSARLPETHQDYIDAVELSKLINKASPDGENVIVSGGGPSIMEAANRGAYECGKPSIGLNIQLPFEQHPNPYSTPALTLNMKYFSTRKFHLVLRANAVVAFPGGLGTIDELFEVLTLKQVGILQDIPIVLYNEEFWKSVLRLDKLVEWGTISEKDLSLFAYKNTPQDAWDYIRNFTCTI